MDIVERILTRANDSHIDIEILLDDCKIEIETLRQQVKKLEESATLESWFTANKRVQTLEANLAAVQQRVSELDGYKTAWVETSKRRDVAEKELASERAISDKLEKAVKESVTHEYNGFEPDNQSAKYYRWSALLSELAAIRKGETE